MLSTTLLSWEIPLHPHVPNLYRLSTILQPIVNSNRIQHILEFAIDLVVGEGEVIRSPRSQAFSSGRHDSYIYEITGNRVKQVFK